MSPEDSAPTDVRVELADQDALGQLVDQWITLASGQRDHGAHLHSEENRWAIRESLARSVVHDEVLVARQESGEDIRGFATFHVESGSFEQDATRGIVQNLHVESDYRDEGVGAALLADAEDRLADRGCSAVALEALADNEDARRFYRRQGYEAFRVEFEKPLDS